MTDHRSDFVFATSLNAIGVGNSWTNFLYLEMQQEIGNFWRCLQRSYAWVGVDLCLMLKLFLMEAQWYLKSFRVEHSHFLDKWRKNVGKVHINNIRNCHLCTICNLIDSWFIKTLWCSYQKFEYISNNMYDKGMDTIINSYLN